MNYWNDKKVLVTGVGGFVGSNLIKALLSKNAFVVTYSSREIGPLSLLTLEGLVNRIARQEKGTMDDFARVDEVVRKNKIDVIFHLAAQPLVEEGLKDPVKTFEVNIKGTWNILETARKNTVRKVVIASTTHVYGGNLNLPYKEEYFPQPSGPYETSKACVDLIAQSFVDSYSLPVEIPRFVNLYGPGDFNFSRIVPKVIKSVIEGKSPEVWDVKAVRDFLYIEDAVRAYLSLAEKDFPNIKKMAVINFGSAAPVSIVDLAKKIVELSGDKKLAVKSIKVPEERTKEIKEQYVSIEKAERELGWKPIYSLEDGLKATLDWYRENLPRINVR